LHLRLAARFLFVGIFLACLGWALKSSAAGDGEWALIPIGIVVCCVVAVWVTGSLSSREVTGLLRPSAFCGGPGKCTPHGSAILSSITRRQSAAMMRHESDPPSLGRPGSVSAPSFSVTG